VGRLAEQYAGRRTFSYNGETHPGLVARCAGILIYAIDGYGLSFEEVCAQADHEVATLIASITPDNRMTEPTRHLKLREAIGLTTEVGQLVKLAEIAAFVRRVEEEFTPDDYVRHANPIKHIAERHGQLVQAMSRLTSHAASATTAAAVRESLIRMSHGADEARKARAEAQRASQGCEAGSP
jgi:3-methyladenine DNA glycosylase Mpg